MAVAQTETRQAARDETTGLLTPAVFWGLAIAVTGALLVLRRPDAVFHAQFWAEDGVVWYADGYNHGALRALLLPRDGYLQVLPRLAAAAALCVPLLRAPLTMNLIALVVESLPALFLVSSRMRNLGPLGLRCALALLYLFVPDSFELHAIMTDSQWNLALLVFLVLIAEAPKSRAGKVFDVAVLALCAVSGPFCVFVIPVALVRTLEPLFTRSAGPKVNQPEQRWHWVQLSVLLAGCIVQGLVLLTARDARLDTALGASIPKLVQIIAGQIVVPVFRGSNRLDQMASSPAAFTVLAFLLTILAAAAFAYGLLRGSLALRCFILFAALAVTAGFMYPTAEPVPYQWNVLLLPDVGLRYWYLPRLALMATLVWMLGRQRPMLVRLVAGVLACIMVFSMVRHWPYPAFTDFNFPSYVRVFEEIPPGTPLQIRVNPGGIWMMTLVKR
jgi:hypothetical protein